MSYINLHSHTDMSNARMLDSLNQLPLLFERVHELDMPGVAITDHEILSNHIKAIQYVKGKREKYKSQYEAETDEEKKQKIKKELNYWNNFKLILGNEIYLTRNNLTKDNYIKGQDKYYHFILLAKDEIGHEQLRRLSSRAWARSFRQFIERVPTYYKDIEEIVGADSGHLIASTACLGSEFANLIKNYINNGHSKASVTLIDNFVNWCQTQFGKENFFIELQSSESDEQNIYNECALAYAKARGLKVILTTDAHYLRKEDRPTHKAYLNAGEGDRETDAFYSGTYFQSEEEVCSYLYNINGADVQEMFKNTLLIADSIQDYDLYHREIVPKVKLDGLKEYDSQIKDLVKDKVYINYFLNSEGEQDRYYINNILYNLNQKIDKPLWEKYIIQIEKEVTEVWEITQKIGSELSSYFNTMQKVVSIMWKEGDSLVGISRGSAGGFVTNFLLGITQMDPIKYGIEDMYWRFIHRDRPELPDCDIDGQASKKEKVFAALQKYFESIGGEVYNIATFGTETAKAAIQTAARGLGYDSDIGTYLSSLIPIDRGKVRTFYQCYYGDAEKGFDPIPQFVKAMNQYPDIWEVACKIEGNICRRGVHACFSADAQVYVRNGTKNISDIQIGDEVLTIDGSYQKVLKTIINPPEDLIQIKSKGLIQPIKTTKNHPFLVLRNNEEQWVPAEELKIGDKLGVPLLDEEKEMECCAEISNKKLWYQIEELKPVKNKEEVYNLSVNNNNTYVVNGAIVHNCGLLITNEDFMKHNALMRAPKGAFCSQFELHDSEYMGGVKFDALTTDALDRIRSCLELLLKDKYIEWQGDLQTTYEKYIGLNNLDYENQEMWNLIGENRISNLFQYDTPQGLATAKLIKPKSAMELAIANSLMRLMADENGVMPSNVYTDYKNNIDLWFTEMRNHQLTDAEIEIMKKHLLNNSGVCESQEGIMMISMDPQISNFNVKEANKLRKTIAKKKLAEIDAMHEMFMTRGRESGASDNLLNYVWDVQVKRQLGYSFSVLHSLGYSLIALQEMNLAYYYPMIFWNCANLIVDSAGLTDEEENSEDPIEEIGGIDIETNDSEDDDDDDVEEDEDTEVKKDKKKAAKTINYGKIATAIGKMASRGISVSLPNINKSNYTFSPDIENERILFGIKGIARINDALAKEIMDKRPFTSLNDFLTKIKINKIPTINLIKAGCFDEIEQKPREEIMRDYIDSISDKKQKLTLQNMNMLIKNDCIPAEFKKEVRIYNFNKFLKDFKEGLYYILNERALAFYEELFNMDYIKQNDNGDFVIEQKIWDKIYKNSMETIKQEMKTNPAILENLNQKLFSEVWNKYANGTISKWEMDSVSFYYHEHELINIDKTRYGIVDYEDLAEEPEVDTIWATKDGKKIPIFKLNRICGTIIDKNKMKNIVTLLTENGVVQLKIYRAQFSKYDKQISVKDEQTGKKTIVERSWFKRGNQLVVCGIRRGDFFIPKVYKNNPDYRYPITLITQVNDDGSLEVLGERLE